MSWNRPMSGTIARRRWTAAVIALLGAALLGGVAVGCSSQSASTSGQQAGAASGGGGFTRAVASGPNGTADGILTAFNNAFLSTTNGAGYYRFSTAGGYVTFFKQAELIEMTEDAYLRTHNPTYKAMIGVLFKGLVAHNGTGTSWLSKSNDDLMWAAVMCLRAYQITGDRAYLDQGKLTFDSTYARAYSTDLGGGLWNTANDLTKNTCVTAPATIAACMLYQDLHDPAYLAKAKAMYAWIRTTLYDPATGAVYDHVTPGAAGAAPVVDKAVWTYNQGGLIGAGNLLYKITGDRQYYDDALKALQYARDNLTVNGVLKSEVGVPPSLSSTAGGFKGMFVRWATMFVRDNHIQGYDGWFQQSVAAVESHLNPAGLMDQNWPVRTGTGTLSAFSCSSAVVLLQWHTPSSK